MHTLCSFNTIVVHTTELAD